MVNHACGFNQSEMGKYFKWIIINLFIALNNRKKLLHHIAMVAKFVDDNKAKIHLQSKFALFQTSLILFNFI